MGIRYISFIYNIAMIMITSSSVDAYKNINGGELKSCSKPGMALTGFTRSGSCVDEHDDQGSHHICINLSSTNGGNFCKVTGQPDWCSDNMECDGSSGKCPVKNWCVCQWAFAAYVKTAGGCDKIQDIVCDAINMEALTAYKEQEGSDKSIADALACVKKRCGV